MLHSIRALTTQLNLKLPIIQAPMAGGISTPKLVAAVSEAGGLGSLPLGYLSIADGRTAIRATKELTRKPFSVNIFVPEKPSIEAEQAKVAAMNHYLAQYRYALGLPLQEDISQRNETSAEEMADLAATEGVKLISFTFGLPQASLIKQLKAKRCFLIGTATSVAEAKAIEQAGFDAVVGQGYEAGGHRGSFLPSSFTNQIGTMSLIPQLVNAVKIPVIAAGGIMHGSAIAAALALGASAAQLGTAFLACRESGASEAHRHALQGDTQITNVYTGKDVRAVINPFIAQMEAHFKRDEIPAYPLQHYLTQKIRVAAVKQQYHEGASFWAGQASKLARPLTVAELMKTLQEEFMQAAHRLNEEANAKAVACHSFKA